MIFTSNKYRLYYNDKSNNKGVYMLSTVEENLKNYTKRQYERANKSREIYQTVVHPSIKDYRNIIGMNAIKNSIQNGRH